MSRSVLRSLRRLRSIPRMSLKVGKVQVYILIQEYQLLPR